MAKDHRLGIGEPTAQALKTGDPPASVVDDPDALPAEVEFERSRQCDAQLVLVHIAVHSRDLPVPTQLSEHSHGGQIACVNDQVGRLQTLYA